MFHKPKGQLAAVILLLSVSSQPIMSYASAPAALAVAAQPGSAPIAATKTTPHAANFSLEGLRQETKTKLSETKGWVKDKTFRHDYENPIKTLETKIDRFQDQVTPAGRSLRTAIKQRMPGKSIVEKGDRRFSIYGLLLIAAFSLVFLLMSLSNPTSRLGGRH